MINFLISIVVFAASVFLLAVSIRYGLRGVARLDNYFSLKNNSEYLGFQWFYRIPFGIGVIPEYFYALVIAHDNYFKRNWWPLKTASFLSVLLFIAGLKSRSAVYDYFSLGFIKEGGFSAFFTSGNFVLFMNIIVILFTTLFILLCIESIRMHGIYAPIRIIAYSILSIMMANLTIITISLIAFVTVVYVILKIIGFLFFSSRRRSKNRQDDEDDETAGTILSKGMSEFKTELYQWEAEEKDHPSYSKKTEPKAKRKRPKITRRKNTNKTDDDVPRLHPN